MYVIVIEKHGSFIEPLTCFVDQFASPLVLYYRIPHNPDPLRATPSRSSFRALHYSLFAPANGTMTQLFSFPQNSHHGIHEEDCIFPALPLPTTAPSRPRTQLKPPSFHAPCYSRQLNGEFPVRSSNSRSVAASKRSPSNAAFPPYEGLSHRVPENPNGRA